MGEKYHHRKVCREAYSLGKKQTPTPTQTPTLLQLKIITWTVEVYDPILASRNRSVIHLSKTDLEALGPNRAICSEMHCQVAAARKQAKVPFVATQCSCKP